MTGIKSAEEIMAEIAESGVDEVTEAPAAEKVKDLGSLELLESGEVRVTFKDNSVDLPLGRFFKVSSRVGVAHLELLVEDDAPVARYTNRRSETSAVSAKEFLRVRGLGYHNLNARNASGLTEAQVLAQAEEVLEELPVEAPETAELSEAEAELAEALA